MSLTRWTTTLVLVALATVPCATGQTPGTDNDLLSLAEIRRLRIDTERDRVLTDELRAQILDLYDVAESSLDQAANYRTAAADFEKERSGIDRIVAGLRSQLGQPERRPQLRLPANPTVAIAEDALARERARLAANRSALRNLERVAEDRAKTRSDLSRRLGELDLELDLLNDELRQQSESAARTELKLAARQSVLARREAALAEIAMLRARLALYGDRSSLIPMQTDLAQGRVAFSEEFVNLLEAETHSLRIKQARESLALVRKNSQSVSERVPSLAPLAAETVQLAETLWAPEGVITRAERTEKALDETRLHHAELNRIADLTSRKFEAYGHRGSVARWWPDVPEKFPAPGSVATIIQELDEEIPEVEHRLITFEQQRSSALDLARKTFSGLHEVLGEEIDPKLAQQVRDLLADRQDLLDELIRRLGRYSNQLVEYRAASDKFLKQVRDVERFLYSHILWSRSVPKPIIPRPQSIGESIGWLVSAEHLRSMSFIDVEFRGPGLLTALFLVVIILVRQPMRRRLNEIADQVRDPARDSLGATVKAALVTLLLAAPLPIALYFAGALARLIGGSTYWHASSEAFSQLALVALLFESVRQTFGPDGLAEAHFGWPVHATQPLHRGLLVTEAVGLPMLYIALHLAFAGMRLDSPDTLQLYNNSLGRVMFVAAMLVFGLSVLAMLRPEKKSEPTEQEMRVPWPRRFAEYAFPTAFLGAYPLIIVATIVPAVLAVFGFYVTGMLLAYQMLRTLVLALAVLVGGGIIHRWRIISRKRSLLESADEADDEKQQREFEGAERQVRKLFRFGVVAVLTVGLLVIWSDAMPMLQILKRVQLLPRVEMLDPVEDTAAVGGIGTDAGGEPARDEPATAAPETGVSAVPSAPVTTAAQPTEDPPLTLWQLLEAILAGFITIVLVKNLPGVIEFMLQRRTTLDGGARFALSTLVRYSITIIGTIIVFGLLGVTWNNVQWLAAALTFGLGFGLQEIVANFVSGLILLVERPVRVGDVVTIGNLMGRVTRIQIRATTITLWDRSEMIVPNKEFITTKLVNWTLSDSKRRIEIPIRITYGTDLEQVKKTLVAAAEQHPSVLADPAPHVLLLEFGTDAIHVELRFVVDFGQGLTAKDQVQMAIDRAFREQGIEFALPKSEVRFVSDGGGPPDEVDPATG